MLETRRVQQNEVQELTTRRKLSIHIHFLDYSDGSTIHIISKFIKLYTLNICILKHTNYTLIKALKRWAGEMARLVRIFCNQA